MFFCGMETSLSSSAVESVTNSVSLFIATRVNDKSPLAYTRMKQSDLTIAVRSCRTSPLTCTPRTAVAVTGWLVDAREQAPPQTFPSSLPHPTTFTFTFDAETAWIKISTNWLDSTHWTLR